MTAPKIEPALTETELSSGVDLCDAEAHVPLDAVLREDGLYVDCDDGYYSVGPLPPVQIAKLIALANAALPDSDPRKITRERIAAIRARTDTEPCRLDHHGYCQAHGLDPEPCPVPVLRLFAAALESYLPPEKP